MSPFLNIIHSHSNVLLHMSQSRALQMIAQTLFILLFPSLNSNVMLHAIFVVGISHGLHIAYDWAKVISSFYEKATVVPLVVGFPKCAALFVCLYQQVQHVCCSILFYLGFVMWSLFLAIACEVTVFGLSRVQGLDENLLRWPCSVHVTPGLECCLFFLSWCS